MSPDCKKSNDLYIKSDYSLFHDCEPGVENKPTSQGTCWSPLRSLWNFKMQKKACAFHHFMKTAKPNQIQNPTMTFSPVTILVNSISPRRTSSFKVKYQSRTYYLELVYLLHITLKCTWISEQLHQCSKQESSTQTILRIKPLVLRGQHLHCICFGSFPFRPALIWYHCLDAY